MQYYITSPQKQISSPCDLLCRGEAYLPKLRQALCNPILVEGEMEVQAPLAAWFRFRSCGQWAVVDVDALLAGCEVGGLWSLRLRDLAWVFMICGLV